MTLDPVYETVPIHLLKPHPQNYRSHPADQLEHIKQSIREYGIYRNIVVAEEYTILAGHGVVLGAKQLGYTELPIYRLLVAPDSILALKLLTGDNEISHLGEIDDRELANILRHVKDMAPDGLMGTGYDTKMLANLAFVTRPEAEIKSIDAALEWAEAGMPDYDEGSDPLKVVVKFETDEDRVAFMKLLGIEKMHSSNRATYAIWWPEKERDDLRALRFVEESE